MSGDGAIVRLTREEGGGLRGRFAFGGVIAPAKGDEESEIVKELEDVAGDRTGVLYRIVAEVL